MCPCFGGTKRAAPQSLEFVRGHRERQMERQVEETGTDTIETVEGEIKRSEGEREGRR